MEWQGKNWRQFFKSLPAWECQAALWNTLSADFCSSTSSIIIPYSWTLIIFICVMFLFLHPVVCAISTRKYKIPSSPMHPPSKADWVQLLYVFVNTQTLSKIKIYLWKDILWTPTYAHVAGCCWSFRMVSDLARCFLLHGPAAGP
jgi:hypothetical protein